MDKIEIYSEQALIDMGWSLVRIPDTGNPDLYSGEVSKTFVFQSQCEPDETEEYSMLFEDMALTQITNAMCCYASAIEYGVELRKWQPQEFYFPFEELYQWISPQQVKQFEDMYPNCVQMSYDSALGLIYSQIGELFDIPAILAGEHETAGTRSIFKWLLCVLTAYNLTSPSAKRSQVLDDNFQLAMRKLTEMKNGASTLANAPIKSPDNAFPMVVSRGRKMLG